MALLTRDWLLGNAQRNRRHEPMSVKIHPSAAADEWSREHAVVADISITRANDDFQVLSLTDADIATVVNVLLMSTGNIKTRSDAALLALAGFSDTELVVFLSKLLAGRTESTPSKG